ncbi:isochorismatase family protein [Ktedonobacter racemifer]|uniref:Isochorismatase hydrolase n=1 Tax=Ktedonobacter racemifer DSM 44963 TaxID=485913 RepID=D6U804_KTERA|nr:isochorismatase family protein [Ktedonobacter racemifer]EFH80015.1 isochorismatase hydrolase [Ktedonobacter racemifer DSM 44963]
MSVTELDEKIALVLIDLQNGFAGIPTTPHSMEEVIANSIKLAETFRQQALPVMLVHVTYSPDGGDMFVPRTDTESTTRRSLGADWDQLVREIGQQGNDIVVPKRSWSAFHGTSLDMHLRRRGITEIVLAGIMTSIGVESTAREAHDHGYHQIFVEDAMSDRSEESHQHTISRIFPHIGRVKSTEEVLSLLAR